MYEYSVIYNIGKKICFNQKEKSLRRIKNNSNFTYLNVKELSKIKSNLILIQLENAM